MPNAQQDPVAFYKFFGVEATKQVKDNHVANCPFANCGKANHFYFNVTHGLYNCKKCNRSGNYYTFITQFHEALKALTTPEDYKFLETERGIPSEVFELANWHRNPNTGRWYVPYYGSNQLLNLGAFDPNNFNPKNRFRIFKAPGFDLQLYKVFNTKQYDPEILVTEGEWDALALYAAFRAMRKEAPTIFGLPGATCWKESWNKSFKGKYLTFFFDKDQGGDQGIEVLRKRSIGLRYSIANWGSSALSKLKLVKKNVKLKDVRDVWTNAKTKTEVLPVLLDMAATTEEDYTEELEQEEGSEVKKTFNADIESIEPVTSYSTFQKRIKESLYTSRSILQTIDAMLATSLSVRLPGEPLWLFVVGPASCGKSTVIEAFGGNNKYFDYVSKLTATSLVSGWRNTDGSDASTLHKMNEKTLFIKDMTVLLGMPDGVQQQLWDLLRDAYDGYVKITWGNGKSYEATDFKFNIIAGVTPIIYKHNDASKGERFLRIDFLGNDFDEDEHMSQAWENMGQKKENKKKLSDTMLGYYKHLFETFNPENVAEVPIPIRNKIMALAKVAARLQAEVVKDRNEGMIYRPRAAVATRLSLQFKNLAHALAHVRGEKVVSEATYAIIRKIGFDSCPGLNYEVINFIHKHKNVTRKSIIDTLKIPSTRVHQILTDLEQLDIVIHDKENNKSGNRGRDTYTYSLCEDLIACLETTRVKTNNQAGENRRLKSGDNNKRSPVKGKQTTKRRG
jgi:hypothetical protein